VQKKPTAFPLGLYGLLLFALCWLVLPAAGAPLERFAVGAACGVARVMTSLCGEPAAAGSSPARARLAELAADLHRRVVASDVALPEPNASPYRQPVHCAVVGIARRGGGGELAELRLDRSYDELAGCAPIVTKGDALVGFLARPGHGPALDDEPGDPARVLLLHHPSGRALHAAVDIPDGGRLRFVLRPAAVVDPAPLRVPLWDDPWRAARLDHTGLPVRSLPQLLTDGGELPAGLRIGTTRVWGYPATADGDSLTLGIFVAPVVSPRSLSHVVAWRGDGAATGDLPERAVPVALRAAVVHDLPGAVHGRHLLVGCTVADGSAVVHDGCLLGLARGMAFGSGLVTSFAASRHRWSLLLLPDDPEAPPRELEGEVVAVDGGSVVVRCRDVAGERLATGQLFTGSNGPHCPAGLWIGHAAPRDRQPGALDVEVPVVTGPRAVEVFSAVEAP